MRRVGSNHAGFCACCEAKLTENERATLSFYGDWRREPWAKVLNKRLHTYGDWTRHVLELRRVLVSLRDDEAEAAPRAQRGGV